jgi:hypothetical protein
MIASRPEIAELLAEMLPHLRRVAALAKHVSGPSRVALDKYVAASLVAQIELRREQLGVKSHG